MFDPATQVRAGLRRIAQGDVDPATQAAVTLLRFVRARLPLVDDAALLGLVEWAEAAQRLHGLRYANLRRLAPLIELAARHEIDDRAGMRKITLEGEVSPSG